MHSKGIAFVLPAFGRRIASTYHYKLFIWWFHRHEFGVYMGIVALVGLILWGFELAAHWGR